MSLSQQLSEDLKQAMKDKDKLRLSVIRMVRAAVKNKEIDSGTTLTDDEIVQVVQKELKQRRDSLQVFESAGRTDLADEVKSEIDILMTYLPAQLSDDELQSLVQEAIAQAGAKSKGDIGKVMPVVMPKVKGRADGKKVQQMVQALLP
ncbi:GatB/YqeY domain-containing protein [Alicyclobacillus tolerans]|uniref:GatB/YqeY domain-containing protein n=1 Tax=Alicyclobacillus tolerans TaxID=90970 RepID=UPI001F2BAF19|nr:GatB/YqeY domain-containing protein [Alicyclobacillus tolerans]MCF8563334.1 GatB/YqeY domain-containing protein [Alicyclobacillus tolerans]